MALFEWTSDYELDVPQIDDQHKELVKMINELYESTKEGKSGKAVASTLNKLLQYVDVHFATEEQSMRDRHYPGLEDHIQVHDDLRRKVFDLKKEQLQGRDIATFELLNFLADWLKNHIANTDTAFGQYIHNQERRGLG